MKTQSNVQIVSLSDGRQVCLSYGVIVAAFIPAGFEIGYAPASLNVAGYVRTKERYSVTTSRHMNQFAGKDAPEIDRADLLKLCSPIQDRLER
jgi:hypothetical protein